MMLAALQKLLDARKRSSFVLFVSAVLVTALAMLLSITGALTAASVTTRDGLPACAERVHIRLIFGLQGPRGPVSEPEWKAFLSEVVTPRFPNGLTIIEANGQWRGTGDRMEREPSRIVEIVQDESPAVSRRLDEIVTIYKYRHQQESVMVTRARLEACF